MYIVHVKNAQNNNVRLNCFFFFFVYMLYGDTPKKLPLPSLKKQKYSQKRAKIVFICSHHYIPNSVYTIGGAENAIKHADIKVNTKSCAQNTRAKISKHFSQSFPQLFLRHFCLFLPVQSSRTIWCVQVSYSKMGVMVVVCVELDFF